MEAIAAGSWGAARGSEPVLDGALIARLYREVSPDAPASRRGPGWVSPAAQLELLGYLELYLWPLFVAEAASPEHVLSIVMVREALCTRSAPACCWGRSSGTPVRLASSSPPTPPHPLPPPDGAREGQGE